VRLLSNLETTDDKLLQIVLVGQPELDDKLDAAGLRQLKQRIALRAHLGALDAEETRGYIEQRLQIAGADPSGASLFPPDTVDTVFRHSRGFPRLINTICENSLITAYARQQPSVTPDIVSDVAREFRLDVVSMPLQEGAASHDERDVERVIGVLLDLYSAMRQAPAGRPELESPLIAEGRKK
jgi:general secretion pathway protein A